MTLESEDPVGHPGRVADRQGKAMSIIVGVMLMAAFCLITFGLVTRYAGGWGVPFFSFTSERGSTCTNTFTGYTCTPVTLADVEFFGDMDLPDDSTIVSGTYRSTHDYRLDAVVEVPAPHAAAALRNLREGFGTCQPGHPSPLNPAGLTKLCVMANDNAYTASGEPDSRLFTIGTGLRKDGSRVISMAIKSR